MKMNVFFRDNQFNRWLFFGIYVVINLFMLFHHESWRDEMQAFSIVRESGSLTALSENTRYEGHPGLWFFILFVVKQISGTLLCAKLTHLLIICAAIFIFIMHAPIKPAWKIAIVFGYFFMYEYSVIVRNYSIGVFFAFLTCYFLQKNKILYASGALALLVNSNAYAWLLGVVMLPAIVLGCYKTHFKETIIAACIGLSGILISVMCIMPPEDSGYASGYFFSSDIFIKAFSTIAKTFIPIPIPGISFWNTSIFEINNTYAIAITALLLSFVIVTCCLYHLRSSFIAQLFFGLSIFVIVVFTAVKYFGAQRHHGHLFIAFIISLWLAELFKSKDKHPFSLHKIKIPGQPLLNKIVYGVIVLILSTQVFTSAIACYYDYKYSFSKAGEAAAYLKKNGMTNSTIVGYYDSPASAIAGYLNKKFFYPNTGRESTYITWDHAWNENPISDDTLLSLMHIDTTNLSPLLITTYPINNDSLLKAENVQLVKHFYPAIERSEEFYLYSKH